MINICMVHLQAPCDNGSKIQNYILQWDEVFIYLKQQFQKKLVTLCKM